MYTRLRHSEPHRPTWDVGTRIRRALQDGRKEALFWVVGLAAVAAMNPAGPHLFSLCPLDTLGGTFCPGCGLGHAVAHLARGAVGASLQAHPLGLPAVLLLLGHVVRLVRRTGPTDSVRSSQSTGRHVQRSRPAPRT